jgi:hypothetical protein
MASINDDWVLEYFHGLGHEMYRIPLDEGYEGLTFSQVSWLLFKQFNYTLFALEILIKDELKVFLNPADYVLPKYKHYGYVLAQRQPEPEVVLSQNIEGIEREQKQLKNANRLP